MKVRARLVALLSAALVTGGLALAPLTARAAIPTLDQSQESFTFENGITGGTTVRQTFTAGRSGGLDQVEVFVNEFLIEAGPLHVAIWDALGPDPGGTLLGAADIAVTALPPRGNGGWVSAYFEPALPSVAGVTYAIVLTSTSEMNLGFSIDAYAGGDGMTDYGSGWTVPGGPVDLMFRTYVAAAPVIDQSNPEPFGGLYGVGGPFKHPGQTFTAGITGTLQQIDLYLAQESTGGTVTVAFYLAEDAGDPEEQLGSVTFPVDALPAQEDATWISLDLDPPLASIAGEEYAFVLSSTNEVDVGSTWQESYPGGHCLWNPPEDIESACDDLMFRTYVSPGPSFAIWYPDGDGDGYGKSNLGFGGTDRPAGYVRNGTDCNDASPLVNPAAHEIVNGIDDDCDNLADEGEFLWWPDADDDDFGDELASPTLATVGDRPSGSVANNTDCDDTRSAVNPSATEVEINGLDDDCDDLLDEEEGAGGAITWWLDIDGDGYGGTFFPTTTQQPGYAPNSADCNDFVAEISPLAIEVDNGIDDDCDGEADEGFAAAWYLDNDGDTYGDPAISDDGPFPPERYVGNDDDCNDGDDTVHPGATELDNDVDDDCDGDIDEGIGGDPTWHADDDGDTYGDPASSTTAASQPDGYVGNDGDCDDTDDAVNPDATELAADGVDQDCDGNELWYRDTDLDTYGSSITQTGALGGGSGLADDSTDCDDTAGTVHPGATEVVADGVDQDCDTSDSWWVDGDGDAYGSTIAIDGPLGGGTGLAATDDDCDDTDDAVNPGATEVVADGVDQDCDGNELWYRDTDLDTYGSASTQTGSLAGGSGLADDSTDCDDTDDAVNPGATEIDNNTDDDCDGLVDEGFPDVTWYADDDGDTYGDATSTVIASSPPEGYVGNDDDCDDTTASIKPGATEVVADGVDQDCDGTERWYVDGDGDSYGSAVTQTGSVAGGSGLADDSTDCDDSDGGVHPGATETYDGVDENCDGVLDTEFSPFHPDTDGDTFGAGPAEYFALQPAGYSVNDTDCDDSSSAVNPSATETYNTVDDDCDGDIDEGFLPFYPDADGDAYGTGTTPTYLLSPPPPNWSSNNTDCNDGNAAINPGAAEIPRNGIDDDCNGTTPDNNAPTPTTADPSAIDEDTPQPITLTADDADLDPLTFTITGIPAHGTLSSAGHVITSRETSRGYVLPGPLLTYTPASNYSGADAFTYRVSDGLLSATDTVALTIAPVADPTNVVYTGGTSGFVLKRAAKVTFAAKLTSTDPACVPGRVVSFTLNTDPVSGVSGAFPVGSATSSQNGSASTVIDTSGWQIAGTYVITTTVSTTTGCAAGSAPTANLTLSAPKK